MAKFLGFLLGVAVALAGPAVFGVLAAPGGIELNAKELALAFGIGALVFWAVVSYFSGAGALGAFVAFGTQVYCWLWIPNRTTNFLNDLPGVTNGMIDGSKQYTLNGVVPILGVISLVYAIQLIVRSVQRRRSRRAEEERLQREQEAAQAQQEADVAAVYPVAGSTYAEPVGYESHTRYDDLFDEPEPVQPRNQADEQTRQLPVGADDESDQTRQFPETDARGNYIGDETVAAPAQEHQSPAAEPQTPQTQERTEDKEGAAEHQQPAEQQAPAQQEPAGQQVPAQHDPVAQQAAAEQQPAGQHVPVQQEPVAQEAKAQDAAPVDETQTMPAAQTQPVEAKAPEARGDEKAPVEEIAPVGRPEPQQAQTDEPKPQQSKSAEFTGQKGMGSEERVGSQYRERMEDPEDTGEFYLAFESPVVKPV